MATQLQLRRGTTSETGSFTGAVGEVTVDTTKDTLVVHDGSTAGGHEVAKNDGSNMTAIDVGDNVQLKMGASDDLQIFHNGNTSFISEQGTGDLYIGASNNIVLMNAAFNQNKLLATTDGALKLYFNGSEKLATTSGGVAVTGTLTPSGVLTANAGVVVDNFTLDGTTLALSSGDMTLDAAGDIILDANGADIKFKDNGTHFGSIFTTSTPSAMYVQSLISGQSLHLASVGGIGLTIDSSTNSTFAGTVTANAGVVVDNITIDGNEIDVGSGDLTLDVASDIILNADGGDVFLADGSVTFGTLKNSSSHFFIESLVSNKDVLIRGNDGGLMITAVEFDMSAAGEATFNAGIKLGDGHAATFGAGGDLLVYHSSNENIIQTNTSDQDLLFKGNDGGSTITALTLDMSAAGAATFSSDVTTGGKLTVSDGGNTTVAAIRFNAGLGISAPSTDQMNFITADVSRFVIAADGSLSTPTLGASNVRFGVNAGNSITSGGNYNTVVGDEAGTSITTGDYNTALGYGSLHSTNTGEQNTAVGRLALRDNTTGTLNVGMGVNALLVNTTGDKNVAIGTQALTANTTADNNTAVGYQTLIANTTGAQNTASGVRALGGNTTGSDNTAVGYEAMRVNTTGSSNVAFGREALEVNTTASNNTGIGYRALKANTTGAYNTTVGTNSIDANTTGSALTALGYGALGANTTGANNVAVGADALDANTTGANNTAVGQGSLGASTTASSNTVVGAGAGNSITTTGGSLLFGQEANTSSNSVSELVIGNSVVGRGNNTGLIYPPGGGGIYQATNGTSFLQTSDKRLKKNIVDNIDGLNKLKDVQVRNFEYRSKNEVTELPNHLTIKKEGVQLGVIAQEIEKVLPEIVTTESSGVKTVNPDNLTWYLVNSVKQLSTQLDAALARITTLEG